MRYIGCKNNLLGEIDSFISANIKSNQETFCDIFSGTTTVARYLKRRYKIISNDNLYFSYVLQKAYIEGNSMPKFESLSRHHIDNVLSYLSEGDTSKNENCFITDNYSPVSSFNRMYFTEENAKRIDFIRNSIENWRNENIISENEYFYLLASLIESVPFVSNITGTYGAYLKHWDKRTMKNIKLPKLEIIDNAKKNEVYNEDVFNLIDNIEGDIIYVDPPYNSRQYASNYHILETIARYDNPTLNGKTGMRDYSLQKSVFCSKNEVEEAFYELIKKARFSHLIVSYNSSGLMSDEFITKTIKSIGAESTFAFEKIPYRKYKSKIYNSSEVFEYLFYINKKYEKIYSFDYKLMNIDKPKLVSDTQSKYSALIKSPLNYIGGKYKLLCQILPLFPDDINTFVDLFCGGCNVGINVNCNHIIFNDINVVLIDLFEKFKETPLDNILNEISEIINEWKLSNINETGYLSLRKHYNISKNPVELFTLLCFSFNYQLRFNNNLEYNNPFGRNRSQFSETNKRNLVKFVNKLQNASSEFTNYDFVNFPINTLSCNDFVYCDPPYLITTGTYNDGNRGFKNWTRKSEIALYDFLDHLNERNIRFALSNVM